MSKSKVTLPASVIDMKPRADRSWKLSFETRELSGEEVAMLADALQGEGWLLYSPNEIQQKDIPEENVESGAKSQSKRLRDVTFILWKQSGEKGDFETFYRTYLEKLIEFTKAKLEPEEGG